MSAEDEFDGPEPGLEDADVVTKYKLAGEMSNRVLKLVVDGVKVGASVLALCKLGDEAILKEVSTVYNKKVEGVVTPKGIAFPTCVSLNNCVCHNSPLHSDPEVLLKEGDVVKIDLGVHIDGYIAPVATTVVVGASKEKPVTGPKADVIAAAHYALEVALRMIKPGASTAAITAALNSVGADFSCTPVEGMLSHQLSQNVIDGAKAIISNPSEQNKKDHKDSTFEVNEVYALDVFMSTGDGKVKPREQRTTVFKKTDNKYQLKMQASRALISEVNKSFNYMPFTLRMLKEENKAKLGVTECVSHLVLQPFDVLWEAEGVFVAQFKVLVLLMSNGTLRITNGTFDPEVYKSEKALLSEEFKKLLTISVGAKSKKKNTKKAGAKKEGEEGAAATAAGAAAADAKPAAK